MNLLYFAISHSGVNDVSPLRYTSSVPQSVIDKVVDQWRTRLRACVKAEAGHNFEHFLYISTDFRRDLTGYFREPLTNFRGILQNRSFFVVTVTGFISQVV